MGEASIVYMTRPVRAQCRFEAGGITTAQQLHNTEMARQTEKTRLATQGRHQPASPKPNSRAFHASISPVVHYQYAVAR
jgi:hypothetical protein